MLLRRETKLFPLEFKHSKDDKQPMSLRIDKRSQSLRYKYVKDCRPDKVDNNKPIGTGLVGREKYKNEGNNIFLGGLVGKKIDEVCNRVMDSRLAGWE